MSFLVVKLLVAVAKKCRWSGVCVVKTSHFHKLFVSV